MSKLKELTSDDITNISEYFGDILADEIREKISIKEIEDITIDFTVEYINNQLDISVDLNLSFDMLSTIDNELLEIAISNSYDKLDFFIDSHYRI